jgi:hypothetical protein
MRGMTVCFMAGLRVDVCSMA